MSENVEHVHFYGCRNCQAQHFEEESIYQEHLSHQSKQGIQTMVRQYFESMKDSANFPELKTPKTHPDHDVIGHKFNAWNSQVYYCDSYDRRIGYWMTNVEDPSDRRNVSERAIGRTFHKVKNKERHYV